MLNLVNNYTNWHEASKSHQNPPSPEEYLDAFYRHYIKKRMARSKVLLPTPCCADEMHISIQTHFRITDVCAIHEYDFT